MIQYIIDKKEYLCGAPMSDFQIGNMDITELYSNYMKPEFALIGCRKKELAKETQKRVLQLTKV
jgi:hypothetical protein